jgi:uncharacterized protein YjiS (DUF1127 family)
MASTHATRLSQLGHAARRGVPKALPYRAVDAVLRFLTAWKNRREVYRLGEFSDTQLADIGLTRSDLHVVIDLPLGRDPTIHLGAIAARHREAEATARWDV